MTLVEITLDVAGEMQLARAFEASSREVEDMSDPLSQFGRHLLVEVGEQFRTEGAHGGEPWRRLSAAYAAWKEERYPGRPLLVATGAMRAAALSPRAVTVTPRRLVYEIDDPKAIYHQKGMGHNPTRRIVELNAEGRRALDRIFADWLTAIRRHYLSGPR